MSIIIDSKRDAEIRAQLNNKFFDFERDSGLVPDFDEVAIDSSWSLSFLCGFSGEALVRGFGGHGHEDINAGPIWRFCSPCFFNVRDVMGL